MPFPYRAGLLAGVLCSSSICFGQITNLKVVTDANPDYSDMASLAHSIASSWESDEEKMWALYYWHHIGRRQTSPMWLRGYEALDPIQQFNNYGFTQCSTISGISAGIWDYMGYKMRLYEIGRHTVCEVGYGDGWHEYDSSLSATYTLCDGKTIAGVRDIGAEGACEASGGKKEMGHVALYHCVNGTSANGYLEGSDCSRSLQSEALSFHPNNLKHQYFYKNADYGHRYILNLRPGESYERFYKKLDDGEGFYVPREGAKKDLELNNPRYRIRGNGKREWDVPLTPGEIEKVVHSMNGLRAVEAGGLQASESGGEVVFKVEGSNVITALDIAANLTSGAALSVSTSNGMDWKEVHKVDGQSDVKLKLISEVNGAYDVLVKATLPANGVLGSIRFDTTTQLNNKTQPRLNIGRNTVYVGAGAATESIVLWPDLREGKTGAAMVDSSNIRAMERPDFRYATLYLDDAALPKGFVTFKVDAPRDITSFTYGGRFTNRAPDSRITLMHSFDNGKTWKEAWQLKDTNPPWDVVYHETITDVPAGTKSILFKYHLRSYEGSPSLCGIYSVRMEVNHVVADPGFKPVEVTFNWSERQADYSLVKRAHTQLIEKVPFTYAINVGGADHPVVDSLRINPKGAAGEMKYGYSDGKDVGGEKWVGTWATYGKNLAQGKPYTSSVPSATNWDAGDPENKKLTDGVVGANYAGGTAYRDGALWGEKTNPEITVDLGQPQKCAAFRIHVHGYPAHDAILGAVKDKVELLTSTDGSTFTSAGFFDFNLRWKDIPVNFMWTDEETFKGHNFLFTPPAPIEARYVKYKLTPARMMGVTEVQVLDSMTLAPFDLKVALPKDAPN